MVVRQLDSNRQALNDLDEVAGGVLGRQECEGLAGAHGETGDPAVEFALAAVHVDLAAHPLADSEFGELGLFEVGVDPDLGERPDGHQVLTCLNVVAGIDVAPGDHAVDLGDDIAVPEVELGLIEVADGLFELGFGLDDGRRPGNHLGVNHVELVRRVLLQEFFERRTGLYVPRARLVPELGPGFEQLPEGLAHGGEVLDQVFRDIIQRLCLSLAAREAPGRLVGRIRPEGPGRRWPWRPRQTGCGYPDLPC